MNGGTFTPGAEQKRPGIYFNFEEVARERIEVGERGTVVLPLELPWGPNGEFVTLSSADEAVKQFQIPLTHSALLPAKEAMKGASEVLIYKLNEGTEATATITDSTGGEGVTVKAHYGGSLGNEITLSISDSLGDSSKKSVKTYLSGSLVHEQEVATADELQDNAYVSFSGTAELTDQASIKLSQGADGESTTEDFTTFLSKAEYEAFDVIALPLADEALKASFVSFVKNLRDNKGKKVQGVVSNFPGADYEGIINVTNGVVLEDGTEVTAEVATTYVAGMSSGSTYTRSLTFMEYKGATDVLGGPNGNDEIEAALDKGEFFFVLDPRDKRVYIEQDINSSLSLDSTSRKNKIVRLKDAIQNDLTNNLKRTISARKNAGVDIPANEDGEQILASMIIGYMNIVVENNGILPFDTEDDLRIAVTDAGDGFNIDLSITPVDAAEKFYFNVEVR